jgi:hypothetical protein
VLLLYHVLPRLSGRALTTSTMHRIEAFASFAPKISSSQLEGWREGCCDDGFGRPQSVLDFDEESTGAVYTRPMQGIQFCIVC